MKKLNTSALVALVAAVALMVSCGKSAKDYRHSLPADTFMTLSYNPKALMTKAGVGDFTQSPLYATMEKSLGESENIEPADRELLLSIAADPSKSGLSMDHDIFLSVKMLGSVYDPQANVVMLARVADRKKVDAMMDFIEKQAGGKMTRTAEGGRTTVGRLDETGTIALVYDNNMFMGYFSEEPYSKAAPVIKQLLEQKPEESLMKLEHAAAAFDADHDMCTVMSFDAMTRMYEDQFASMPMMDMYKTAYFVAPANFEKGRMVATMETYFTDPEAEKTALEFSAKMSGKINGEMVKYVDANAILAVAANINGSALYETFARMPAYSSLLSMAPQVKTVMDAIQGDMVLALTDIENISGANGGMVPRFVAMIELADPGVFNEFTPMLKQAGARETNPGHWMGRFGGFDMNFGVMGNMFYATNDPDTMTALAGTDIESLDDRYGNVLRGSYGAMFADFNMLRLALESDFPQGDPMTDALLAVAGMFDTLVMSTREMTVADVTLNMNDKEKNAADVIYHTIEALVQKGIESGAM